MTTFRAILFIALSLSIAVITLPAQAEISPHHEQKCCCARAATDVADKIDNHCHREPVKSQDRQCCGGCPIGLALISAAAQKFVFPKVDGQKFGDGNVSELTRADRPPVPPPRA